MRRETVAARAVALLQDLGVEVVFTLCGNHVLPLYEAMRRQGMRAVATRSEAAAVHAADAYARVSRKVGVAIVTGGPGLANTVPALLTAADNRSPVLLLSGEGDSSGRGRGGMQDADHVAITRAVTRESGRVDSGGDVERWLRHAIRLSTAAPTGPVHLSLPLDVQRAAAPAAEEGATAEVFVGPGAVDADVMRRTGELIRAADRPAIVIGGSAWMRGGAEVCSVLGAMRVPMFTLDSARGMVPDSHTYGMGSADPSLNDVAKRLRQSDVICIIGRPVDFRLQMGGRFAPDAQIIHIDEDVRQLGVNQKQGIAAFGDSADFLIRLVDELDGYACSDAWLQKLRSATAGSEGEANSLEQGDGGPLHPLAVAGAIAEATRDRDVIYALDCGEFVQWCRRAIPLKAPGRWLRLGGQAACGLGLPFGIGAAVASKSSGSNVLVIAGDGGIGYHISEINTAVQSGLDLTIVIGVDGSWGVEKSLQEGIFGSDAVYAAELERTDLVQVSRGLGASAHRVSDVHDLPDAIDSAMSADGVTVLEVPIRNVASSGTLAMVVREKEAMERAMSSNPDANGPVGTSTHGVRGGSS